MNSDIIIIGGGIAGISLGAQLSGHARVTILEMENQPGYHATGRSAAYFAPAYGNETVRQITAASESFFRTPPENFTDVPLIHPRESLFIARKDQAASMSALLNENDQLIPVETAQMVAQVPILNPSTLLSGARDPAGGDLDVHALLQGFIRLFRANDCQMIMSTLVTSLFYRNGLWTVKTNKSEHRAPTIVNAAGAWADQIAQMAGLQPLSIRPFRRTALLIDIPGDIDITDWPLVIDVDEQFYFKPDAGKLLISPADETLCEPCDAQPDEIDVATVVDRIQQATSLNVMKINHRWAGLRTFAPDR